MATINLGAIKFNWKGAYNSGTTYAVDDVVSSGGNSYVCIQAHSNQAVGNATAYWNIMSSAGTNGSNGSDGTDLTTLTTQGDILYRDGSGLQRLPKGTAGQVLQMNSGANAPEYATASSGGLKQVVYATNTTKFVTTATSFVSLPPQITITPSSTSSKIVIQSEIAMGTLDDGYPELTLYRSINNSAFSEVVTRPTNANGGSSQGVWVSLRNNSTTNANRFELNGASDIFRDAPNTTSTVVYKWYGNTNNGGGLYINTSEHDYAGNQNSYNMQGVSKMIAWEISV